MRESTKKPHLIDLGYEPCGQEMCLGTAEVYDAEQRLTYEIAGRMLAKALYEHGVDRYDVIKWQAHDASGEIDLDLIQADGLPSLIESILP